jgi:hypothetical protein
MGLVLGTSTFLKAQKMDAKETKKMLYALEGGSSVARVSFQKVCFCSSRHVSFAATMPRCICEIMNSFGDNSIFYCTICTCAGAPDY